MARVLHQPVPAPIAQLLPVVSAIADTPGLTTVALVATPTGGTAPYTYAWTVNGVTTGIVDATAASTTYPPTSGGRHAARCVVTDALGVVAEQTEEWTVGAQDATSKRWWVKLWEFIPADLADHDFASSALTVDGVEVRNGSEGAVTTMAISSGVCTCDTIAAIGGLWIYPVEAYTPTMQREYCIIAGLGADLTADDDGVFMAYSNFGGTIFGAVEANRSAGAQRVSVFRAGGIIGHKATAGGAQARAIGLHWAPGRQSFRPLLSLSAWSGGGPTPVDMTAVALTPSGWHVATDVTPAETADEIPADNAVGASQVECVLKCRPANGRAYTLPGWTLWATL